MGTYSLVCFIINSICLKLYKKEYKEFIKTKDLEKAQLNKLKSIIQNNKNTVYGKKFNFKNINSYDDFKNDVPLTDYEDYIPYIENIKKGEGGILTQEDVLLLELTSGSTFAKKLIPYTKGLKDEFQKGIRPWIYNLYTSYPEIKWGKSYWSITPIATKREFTEGGIPIGFENDSDYFGKFEKYLIERIFAVKSEISKEKSIEDFYFKTSIELLKCKNLRFISVWSPTYLIILLDYIYENKEKLLKNLPKKRKHNIENALINKEYERVWPKLKVISSWCHGSSKHYLYKLVKLFKNVTIEPKGLIATEFFASFPFINEKGARLSINSHFFEFLSLKDNKIYLSHEIISEKEYEIIVTTSGGFYRYKTGDIVMVSGFYENIPLIEFMRRNGRVSDLFGEKLNEGFVRNAMLNLGIEGEFLMVAPEKDRYVLYIKGEIQKGKFLNLDKALRENFHYDYCRKLGQLKEIRIFILNGNPEKEYTEYYMKKDMRIGDIKPALLSLNEGFDKVFKGYYLNLERMIL